MITEIRVSNFRSLGMNVKLRLGAMTALVGPNGTGKSNIADVFRFVAETLTIGLESAIASRHGINALRRWTPGRPFNLGITLSVSEPSFSGEYGFVLAGDSSEEYQVKEETALIMPKNQAITYRYKLSEGKWLEGPSDLRPKVTGQSLALTLVGGDERFAPLAGALKNMCVYSIFPDRLREPQKPDPIKPMKQHGENWATILQGLSGNGGATEIKAALAKLTGDITGFRVRQLGGYLNAEFLHDTPRKRKKDRQKWFEGAQESDGTLRVAGIITALIQEPPLTLIGIEEPELTVHVGAIPLLFDYLKEASRREQVLLTTHSVELLERLDIEDIRVVERVNGATKVSPVNQTQRESVKKRLLTVGELISMEGLQPELLPEDGAAGKED
ncbi:MAG: AAA family ATPase [Verrucomicrobiota bacterium]